MSVSSQCSMHVKAGVSIAYRVTWWALLSTQGGKLAAQVSALNVQHCNSDILAGR